MRTFRRRTVVRMVTGSQHAASRTTSVVPSATWESKPQRDAMEANENELVREIIAEQALFCDVRVIGEFEDAEWIVDPHE